MTVDTVTRAGGTPDEEQPWRELGLREEEYGRIREILGRRPTTAELAMYSVMWSEHCSYKSSKVHLRRFGDLPRSEALLVGMGENAGVVDVGDGYAVTFKVESHNHPSYVEPYQGAATGVGGIVRDILTMGARGCCPAWWPAWAATATAWACPTSAASCSSTTATSATRWSTRCASAS
jgi:phosphoribosylformylglycinamidine (FGAM) synthase-like enzyme